MKKKEEETRQNREERRDMKEERRRVGGRGCFWGFSFFCWEIAKQKKR
jgi:hypothetical protein